MMILYDSVVDALFIPLQNARIIPLEKKTVFRFFFLLGVCWVYFLDVSSCFKQVFHHRPKATGPDDAFFNDCVTDVCNGSGEAHAGGRRFARTPKRIYTSSPVEIYVYM